MSFNVFNKESRSADILKFSIDVGKWRGRRKKKTKRKWDDKSLCKVCFAVFFHFRMGRLGGWNRFSSLLAYMHYIYVSLLFINQMRYVLLASLPKRWSYEKYPICRRPYVSDTNKYITINSDSNTHTHTSAIIYAPFNFRLSLSLESRISPNMNIEWIRALVSRLKHEECAMTKNQYEPETLWQNCRFCDWRTVDTQKSNIMTGIDAEASGSPWLSTDTKYSYMFSFQREQNEIVFQCAARPKSLRAAAASE